MSLAAFERDGYAIAESVIADDECDALRASVQPLAASAGRRDLLDLAACRQLAQRLRASDRLRDVLPRAWVAVQCTLFAKGMGRNWLVPPHQDLSIPVQDRVQTPQCTGWSFKSGDLFVQPPTNVLEQLVAIRLQLDPHAEFTGPLHVLPGSHRRGRLASDSDLREGRAMWPCVVGKGGVVLMRPLLVHASSKARIDAPRRVLHFLFGPPRLPHGLCWARTA